jgi:serine/threonine-protein kinase RsbW
MTGWRLRRPPDVEAELARWVLAAPHELSLLRAALVTAVAERAPAATVDVVDLEERLMIVATELAGNALRHGSPPAVVALLQADGRLILDVVDNDPDRRPAIDEARAAGDGGLGLPMAARLAEEVGWYPTGTGKHVWALFAT